jgi:hypothetical protein
MSTDRAAETAEGQRTRPGRKQGATGEFTTSWKVEAQAARLEKMEPRPRRRRWTWLRRALRPRVK